MITLTGTWSISHYTCVDLVSVRKRRTLNLKVSPFLCVCVPACVFQVGHSFMRVSLTLKPNSRSDFGFQTRRDSTGATVQFIQPGETFDGWFSCSNVAE